MVRVIIERYIAQGMAENYEAQARSILNSAMHVPGFVSGESLRDERDPDHRVLLSSWRSAADWHHWHNSPQRREMMGRIRPILEKDERIVVLDYAPPVDQT